MSGLYRENALIDVIVSFMNEDEDDQETVAICMPYFKSFGYLYTTSCVTYYVCMSLHVEEVVFAHSFLSTCEQ